MIVIGPFFLENAAIAQFVSAVNLSLDRDDQRREMPK
jgi:hypothetical protein